MNNIYPVYNQIISRQQKEDFLKQKAKVIWFTGLSGSGKTTLASGLEKRLFNEDGDNIRSGINNNLGFSVLDRKENIRRIAEISKLFLNCGVILLCTFISPTDEIRDLAKEIIGANDFLEIFVNTPLETCENRDPKGLYKKARKGEIQKFTGISSPFEEPKKPFLNIDNSNPDINQTIEVLFKKINKEITFTI